MVNIVNCLTGRLSAVTVIFIYLAFTANTSKAEEKMICIPWNIIEICGPKKLMDKLSAQYGLSIAKNMYENEMQKIALKNGIAKERIHKALNVLDDNDEITVYWHSLVKKIRTEVSSGLFIDSEIKEIFYELYPSFPRLPSSNILYKINLMDGVAVVESSFDVKGYCRNLWRDIFKSKNLEEDTIKCEKKLSDYYSILVKKQYNLLAAQWAFLHNVLGHIKGNELPKVVQVYPGYGDDINVQVDKVGNIYLPEGLMTRFSREKLKIVMLHEISHLKYYPEDIRLSGTIITELMNNINKSNAFAEKLMKSGLPDAYIKNTVKFQNGMEKLTNAMGRVAHKKSRIIPEFKIDLLAISLIKNKKHLDIYYDILKDLDEIKPQEVPTMMLEKIIKYIKSGNLDKFFAIFNSLNDEGQEMLTMLVEQQIRLDMLEQAIKYAKSGHSIRRMIAIHMKNSFLLNIFPFVLAHNEHNIMTFENLDAKISEDEKLHINSLVKIGFKYGKYNMAISCKDMQKSLLGLGGKYIENGGQFCEDIMKQIDFSQHKNIFIQEAKMEQNKKGVRNLEEMMNNQRAAIKQQNKNKLVGKWKNKKGIIAKLQKSSIRSSGGYFYLKGFKGMYWESKGDKITFYQAMVGRSELVKDMTAKYNSDQDKITFSGGEYNAVSFYRYGKVQKEQEKLAKIEKRKRDRAILRRAMLKDRKNEEKAKIVRSKFNKTLICNNCDLSGMREHTVDYSWSEAKGSNFSKKDKLWSKYQFKWANLKEANFSGTTIRDTTFYKANLKGADFSGARIGQTNFAYANLENANFRNTFIGESLFNGANLRNADFTDAKIVRTDFSFSDFNEDMLISEDFDDVKLKATNLDKQLIGIWHMNINNVRKEVYYYEFFEDGSFILIKGSVERLKESDPMHREFEDQRFYSVRKGIFEKMTPNSGFKDSNRHSKIIPKIYGDKLIFTKAHTSKKKIFTRTRGKALEKYMQFRNAGFQKKL